MKSQFGEKNQIWTENMEGGMLHAHKKLATIGFSNYFKSPLGKSACFSMFSNGAAAEFKSVCVMSSCWPDKKQH